MQLFYRTLEERADRLFQTKGVPLESLDSSLFAKSKSAQSRDPKKQKEIALLEAQIYRYTELLGVCCFPNFNLLLIIIESVDCKKGWSGHSKSSAVPQKLCTVVSQVSARGRLNIIHDFVQPS